MKSLCIFAISTFLFVSIASARPLPAIMKSGKLRMCYVPWLGEDTAKNELGAAYDTGIMFADYLGVTAVPIQKQWDELFHNDHGKTVQADAYTPALFANDTCDIYANHIVELDWRLTKMDIVRTYVGRDMVVVKKSEQDRYRKLEDLAGKRATVVKNTSYHQWLLQQNQGPLASNPIKINVIEPGGTQAYILKGEADFVVLGAAQALYSVKHLFPDLALAFAVGSATQIGWAVPKGQKELREKAVAFIKAQKQSGASPLNRIYRKYFGVNLLEFEELLFYTFKP